MTVLFSVPHPIFFKRLFITISHVAIYGPSFLDPDQYFGFLLFNKIVGWQVCILIPANKYLKLYLKQKNFSPDNQSIHTSHRKSPLFQVAVIIPWCYQKEITTLKHWFHLTNMSCNFPGSLRGLIWQLKILWVSPNIWKVTSSCIMCQVEKFLKRAANTSPTWRRLKTILLQTQGGREVIWGLEE